MLTAGWPRSATLKLVAPEIEMLSETPKFRSPPVPPWLVAIALQRHRGGWQDTALSLPAGAWADLLTGTVHRGDVPMTALTGRLPVALLVPQGGE